MPDDKTLDELLAELETDEPDAAEPDYAVDRLLAAYGVDADKEEPPADEEMPFAEHVEQSEEAQTDVMNLDDAAFRALQIKHMGYSTI